jgi:hypothetical protein
MTISVSRDGYTFEKTYTVRKDYPDDFLFSGVTGRTRGFAYSSSIVNNDTLYILHSVSKEYMEITRVPVASFELE